MRRLLRNLLNAATVLSVVAAITLVGWRLFGRPLERVNGYIIMPLIAPPNPIYEPHFDLFGIPYWAHLAITLLLPVWWLDKQLQATKARWRMRRVGRCPSCNYDLRATPDRCPECGTIPAAARRDAPARNPADGAR